MNYILAHDLGTSGDKAALFTAEGGLVRSVTAPYPCRYSPENRVEQDPEAWYGAVCSSTKELLRGVSPADVAAVSFSGHMMGVVLLDGAGRLLRPAIIWADQRASEERRILGERVGDDRFYRITGNRNNPTNSIAKLMWIMGNEGCGAAAAKSLNCKDYIAYRLTGVMGTDYSDASGTGAFDINSFQWSGELLEAAGIDRGLMPELQASTDLAGRITAQAALDTGLLEGTPVYRGCGDGTAASVGAGLSCDGDLYCCIGSSAWVSCKSGKPLLDAEKRTFNLAGIGKGSVFPIGTMQAAGLSYNWMRDELCRYECEKAKERGVSVYDLVNSEIAGVPVGSGGVLFLPYLMGERSPWWDARAKGAFLGLGKATTHEEMLRAVMEGITMNLALILRVLRQRYDFREMRVIGGCAQDPVWRQMLADAFGLRVLKPNRLEEACSMGAAVVAGIGAGIFPDESAIKHFVRVDNVAEADADHARDYAALLPKFEKCCVQLMGLFS